MNPVQLPLYDESVRQRFWAKVDKNGPTMPHMDTPCWPWTATRGKKGHGKFHPLRGSTVNAARVAYELATGTTLGELQADHICHNPPCCNPAHLRPATNKQNQENLRGARCDSTTGVRGVTKVEAWSRAAPENIGKYRASLMHHGKCIVVGFFDTLEEADVSVRAKRSELFTHNDADKRT